MLPPTLPQKSQIVHMYHSCPWNKSDSFFKKNIIPSQLNYSWKQKLNIKIVHSLRKRGMKVSI